MGETILLGLGWRPQSETPLLRNEAPLNCVALRSALDYEVTWRPVKGQDERQNGALDSSPCHLGACPNVGKKK